ncbi:MAG: hypothetical protein KGJ28_11525 [Alphaproteobacteria bacterium]|nr:hypothetical protein [Alphaproteobacteria bacterium]
MSALMEIWHAIHAVVASADYYTLGAAVIVIVIAGFLMESVSSVVPVTIVSLLAFVLVKAGIAMATGHHDIAVLIDEYWVAFKDLPMLILLAYLLIFGVLISVVRTVRNLIR